MEDISRIWDQDFSDTQLTGTAKIQQANIVFRMFYFFIIRGLPNSFYRHIKSLIRNF